MDRTSRGTAALAVAACGVAFHSGHETPLADSGADAGDDATPAIPDDDAGFVIIPPQKMPDSGPCPLGARRCSADGEVEICGADGAWGNPISCGSDASVCASGACIAPSLDGGVTTPASCLAGGTGLSTCGDSGVESCCTSLEVTSGTFYRTYTTDPDSGAATGETDQASVSGFRLDKYEVTVGRFRQFVNAVLPPDAGAGWAPAVGSGKHTHLNNGRGLANVATDAGAYEPGWVAADDVNIAPTSTNLTTQCTPTYFATWTDVPTHNDDLPTVCQNWWEAYAFCIWDGGFLPSAAELNYAASGGNQQREYPWGSRDPGTANLYAIFGCHFGPSTCGSVANIASVGTPTLGAGLWGQLDLAGNVSERGLDATGTIAPYVVPCADCVALPNPAAVTTRMHRGGWYDVDTRYFGSSEIPPTLRGSGTGIRCARAP